MKSFLQAISFQDPEHNPHGSIYKTSVAKLGVKEAGQLDDTITLTWTNATKKSRAKILIQTKPEIEHAAKKQFQTLMDAFRKNEEVTVLPETEEISQDVMLALCAVCEQANQVLAPYDDIRIKFVRMMSREFQVPPIYLKSSVDDMD